MVLVPPSFAMGGKGLFTLSLMFLKLHDYIEQIFFFQLKIRTADFKKKHVICLIEQFVFSFFHNYILSV